MPWADPEAGPWQETKGHGAKERSPLIGEDVSYEAEDLPGVCKVESDRDHLKGHEVATQQELAGRRDTAYVEGTRPVMAEDPECRASNSVAVSPLLALQPNNQYANLPSCVCLIYRIGRSAYFHLVGQGRFSLKQMICKICLYYPL